MPELITETRSFVAGRWVDGATSFPVEDPATESPIAQVSAVPSAEVDRAIEAARRSFDEGAWSQLPARERASVLHALIDAIDTQRRQLVATMVAEAGQPVRFAETTQLDGGLALARET